MPVIIFSTFFFHLLEVWFILAESEHVQNLKLFVISSKNLDSGVGLMQLVFEQHMILNNDNPKEEITKNIRDLLKIKLNWKEQKMKLYSHFCKKINHQVLEIASFGFNVFDYSTETREKKLLGKNFEYYSFFIIIILF